jgi:probable HAF family extracellular repeat protein
MSDEIEYLSLPESPYAYAIRNMGLLTEGRLSHAFDINENGEMVGEADMELGVHAVLWRQGVLTDLGPKTSLASKAIAINDHRNILGIIENPSTLEQYSCLWTVEKVIDLSGLGIAGSGVKDLNNDNLIVGETDFGQDGAEQSAFLWKYGQLIDIAGANSNGSCAEAVNSHGQVAGRYISLYQTDQAFLWSEGQLYNLGLGQASGINDNGIVAGRAYKASNQEAACYWELYQRFDLELLPGFTSSYALDINNSMEIVGSLNAPGGRKAAMLWKNGYTIDLNTVIDQTLGWDLQEATGINESGQIVGWGFYGHRRHGFRLTPSDRAPRPGKNTPRKRENNEAQRHMSILYEESTKYNIH